MNSKWKLSSTVDNTGTKSKTSAADTAREPDKCTVLRQQGYYPPPIPPLTLVDLPILKCSTVKVLPGKEPSAAIANALSSSGTTKGHP